MSIFQHARTFLERVSAPIRSSSIVRCEESVTVPAATEANHEHPTSTLAEDDYIVYHVLGFPECPWFHRASCIAQDLERQPQYQEQVECLTWPIPRQDYGPKLDGLAQFVPEIVNHHSCPAILETKCRRDEAGEDGVVCDPSTLVGGYAQLEELLRTKYKFKSTYCQSLTQMTGNGKGAC